jgi:hypothetical protein
MNRILISKFTIIFFVLWDMGKKLKKNNLFRLLQNINQDASTIFR